MRKHDGKYVHYSKVLTQSTNGQPLVLDGEDLCPPTSPRGLPLVIERMDLICILTSASLATTAVSGEDVWRCARNVQLTQIDGVNRINNLHGDQLRLAAVEMAGVGRVREHADWATGSLNGTRVQIAIPLGVPQAYAEFDTECMAAVISKLSWTGVETGAAGPCVAGGALTFTSATWTVRVQCREVTYLYNAPASAWEVVEFATGETSKALRFKSGVPGAILLHVRGADGGGSLSTLTSVYIDEFGNQPSETPTDIVEVYESDRGVARGWGATTGGTVILDPFIVGDGLPVMFAGQGQKSKGAPRKRLTLNASASGSALANLTALVRTITPRHDALRAELQKIYAPHGVFAAKPGQAAPKGTHAGWRNKTRDRTQRTAGEWSTQFLPQKSEINELRGAR